MANLTRRSFLEAGLLVPAVTVVFRATAHAAQGLGQFTVAGPPPCTDTRKPTPAIDAPHFKPKSPVRTSLVEAGVTGEPIVLSGAVIGLTCGNVKGAVVDVWQADSRGVYDAAGFRFRGHQLTDADGRYKFTTTVPGAVAGRAKRINVKVQPPGKPMLTTQLFFPDDPLNAKDPAFRPELLVKMTGERDKRVATFDFILDI